MRRHRFKRRDGSQSAGAMPSTRSRRRADGDARGQARLGVHRWRARQCLPPPERQRIGPWFPQQERGDTNLAGRRQRRRGGVYDRPAMVHRHTSGTNRMSMTMPWLRRPLRRLPGLIDAGVGGRRIVRMAERRQQPGRGIRLQRGPARGLRRKRLQQECKCRHQKRDAGDAAAQRTPSRPIPLILEEPGQPCLNKP